MKKIMIIGNVGSSGGVKQTEQGTEYLGFTIAVNTKRGEKRFTDWFKCTLWGKRARSLAPYVVKGQSLFVDGEPSLRTFQKKDGSSDASIEINVSELALLGGGDRQRIEEQGVPVAEGLASPAQQQAFDDSDIPF